MCVCVYSTTFVVSWCKHPVQRHLPGYFNMWVYEDCIYISDTFGKVYLVLLLCLLCTHLCLKWRRHHLVFLSLRNLVSCYTRPDSGVEADLNRRVMLVGPRSEPPLWLMLPHFLLCSNCTRCFIFHLRHLLWISFCTWRTIIAINYCYTGEKLARSYILRLNTVTMVIKKKYFLWI